MIVTSNIDDQKWDIYVGSHPFGNIFQTTAIYNVYKNTKNHHPVRICGVDENTGEINGVLLGVTICEMTGLLGKGLLRKFTTRSVVSGGPLISENSPDTLLEIILEYDRKVQKESLYTEIRNLYDTKSLIDNAKHYIYEDHLNFWIDLDKTEENVWKQIHKSRKKNINRAAKAGIIIEEINSKKLITVFYNLLKETYAEVHVPLADITLFESAFDQLVPKNMARFFLAKYNDTYIGARAVLTYKNVIHDWYAGSLNNASSLYPNDYLVWYILEWGIKNNYKLFDFGGAGRPDIEYGPREFKRRFGGDLVNYGRHTYTHSPTRMKVTDVGFKLYQKLPL